MSARLLANHPENGCVGCGPANERGLRLSFEAGPRDSGAETTLTTAAWMCGWPGTVHTGILYIALIEAMNWALHHDRGRVGLPHSTSALETMGRVAVGLRVGILAKRSDDQEMPTYRAEARHPDGTLLAALERTYTLPTEAEIRERLGYDGPLPIVLEGLAPP